MSDTQPDTEVLHAVIAALVAMLHEVRPHDEITEQILQNRGALNSIKSAIASPPVPANALALIAAALEAAATIAEYQYFNSDADEVLENVNAANIITANAIRAIDPQTILSEVQDDL